MTPDERHTANLAALNEQAYLADLIYAEKDADGVLAGIAGRFRILVRHAPKPVEGGWDHGAACSDWCDGWPCPDYRDAAAGLPGMADLPPAPTE